MRNAGINPRSGTLGQGVAADCGEFLLAGVSTTDPDEVLTQLSQLVGRRIDYDWFRICLCNQHEESLRERFIVFDEQVIPESGKTVPLRDSTQGEAILLGRPVVCDGAQKVKLHVDERPVEDELGSMIVLPLRSKGQTIGTLDLGRRGGETFSKSELSQATEMAGHIGVVVEHAWMLEESKELARMEERGQLAREFHDAIVRALLRIVLHLELAERRLRSDVRAAHSEIREARQSAHQCLDEARRSALVPMARNLDRPSLDDAVLEVVRALEPMGTGVRLHSEGPPRRLHGALELALTRIVQEAVANIRRHARADEVNVGLTYGPEAVKVTISDNGVGFDPSLVLEQNGSNGKSGIAAARERALLAGGDLWVESTPGQGTTFVVQIPTADVDSTPPTAAKADQARPNDRVRVLIVDGQVLFRQGLHQILEQAAGIEVVGEAADADEALQKADVLRPDVAIVDTHLSGASGVELVSRLRERNPETRALILSVSRGGDLVRKALTAGACGYLLRDVTGSAVVDAVRAVHRGEMLLHPAAKNDFAMTLNGPDQVPGGEALSERERAVLQLIATGRRNKEIAHELKLTEATIKYHVTNVLGKLGAGSRTEAIIRAQKLGMLTLEFG